MKDRTPKKSKYNISPIGSVLAGSGINSLNEEGGRNSDSSINEIENLEELLFVLLQLSTTLIYPNQQRLSDIQTKGLSAIGSYFKADAALVFGTQDASNTLARKFVWNRPGLALDEEVNISDEVANKVMDNIRQSSEKTLRFPQSNSRSSDPRTLGYAMQNHLAGSVLIAPMLSGEERPGFMALWAKNPEKEWPEEAEMILQIYCQLLVNLTLRISEERQLKSNEYKLRHTILIERQLNALKSRFVSLASHDFRTPLAQILTAAESVKHYRNRMNEDEIDKRLQLISEQIKALNSHMEMLIHQSKREENKIIFKPKIADLVGFIRTVCKTTSETPEFVHQLEIHLPNSPIACSFDSDILHSVISILVSNAANYSEPQNPILVSLVREKQFAVLTIGDKGIGIPEKEIDKVFTAYYRASNLQNQRGLGLGLPLAKDAISLHGGTIEITSKLHAGTTATCRFPVIDRL